MTYYCSVFTPNRTWCPPMNGTLPPMKVSYTQIEYIIEFCLVIIIAAFGLIGNALSVIVMYKDKERRETFFLLQILAIADSFYLIMCLFRYSTKYILPINEYYKMQLYVFPLTKTAQTAAVWTMLLVTVDRYIYICQPLKAQQRFSSRGRRVMAVLVFLLAFLYNMPRFFDSCLMAFVDPCTNRKLLSKVYSPTFNRGNIYLNVYVYGLYIVFLYLGPLCTIIVLNAKLISAIQSSRKRHNQISVAGSPASRRNGENNATVILIIIIIIFIVCETPELILKSISLLNSHLHFISPKSVVFNSLSTVITLLMVTNSAVNFIVYVGYGKRFRKLMWKMLKPPAWCCSRACSCRKTGSKEPEPYRLPKYRLHLNNDTNGSVTHNTILMADVNTDDEI